MQIQSYKVVLLTETKCFDAKKSGEIVLGYLCIDLAINLFTTRSLIFICSKVLVLLCY